MKIKILDNFDEFVKLQDQWNEVLSCSQTNFIFLTHQWLSAWLENYNSKHKLHIIIIEKDDEIVGIAPLMIERGKKLQFIGHDVSDYMDFIIASDPEDCFRLIFEELGNCMKSWDWAEFIYLQQGSPYFDLWGKNIKSLKTLRSEIKRDCSSIVLDLYKNGGNWESLEKTLPSKRRNDLKRCQRLLNEKGSLRLERLTEFNNIVDGFENFADNHRLRWKEDGQGSQFDNALQIKRYINIARNLAPMGWVELSCLRLNEEYVAFAFGYIYGGRYYYYTPTFNPEYWKFSPGNMLIKYLIEAFYVDGKIRIFDLLRGEEKYKYTWSKDECYLYRGSIYPFKLRSAYLLINHLFVAAMLPRLQKYQFLRKLKHLVLRLVKK